MSPPEQSQTGWRHRLRARMRRHRGRSRRPLRAPVTVCLLALLFVACSGPDSTRDSLSGTPTATIAAIPDDSTPAATETLAPQPSPTGATTGQASPTLSATLTATTPPDAETPATTATEAQPTPTPPPATPTPDATATTPPVAVQPDPVNAEVFFEQVGAGFVHPTLLTHAGDGTGTLYITEKGGRIFTLDGVLFLDLTNRVINTGLDGNSRELGLLGLAFHPDFENNGEFYVHYNDLFGDTVISRFRTGPNGAGDPTSEEILLTLDQPEDHFNGGTILFGPDGYLYIALGTGGNRRVDHENSQDLDSLFGKLLRIDVDNGDPYAIPSNNPFVDTPDARPEVWMYGLRNPWRFDFDEATGDVYIAEPGQFGYEWVHYQPATDGVPLGGVNFGWPIYEGRHCFDIESETASDPGNCAPPENYQAPIIEYPRGQNGGCVIIGGAVYRGVAVPQLNGAYLYSDFCSARVSAAWRDAGGAWQTTSLVDLPGLVSSFGEDEAGELYVLSISEGLIYKIAPA